MKYKIMITRCHGGRPAHLMYPDTTSADYIKKEYSDINEAYNHMNWRVKAPNGGGAGNTYEVITVEE